MVLSEVDSSLADVLEYLYWNNFHLVGICKSTSTIFCIFVLATASDGQNVLFYESFLKLDCWTNRFIATVFEPRYCHLSALPPSQKLDDDAGEPVIIARETVAVTTIHKNSQSFIAQSKARSNENFFQEKKKKTAPIYRLTDCILSSTVHTTSWSCYLPAITRTVLWLSELQSLIVSIIRDLTIVTKKKKAKTQEKQSEKKRKQEK